MSVLMDYFRAESRIAAKRAFERGPLPDLGFDAVDGKHIDPVVVLGALIAIIRKVPWNPDLVMMHGVWPDPMVGGESPILIALDDDVRDTLATLDVARGPAIANEWAKIEEFEFFEVDGPLDEVLLPKLEELVGLAKRAKDRGEQVYCWICA